MIAVIPRLLPRLVNDALTNGWSVHLTHGRVLLLGRFTSPDGDDVELEWEDGRAIHSAINGTPTPYTQCVKLIRSTEEN